MLAEPAASLAQMLRGLMVDIAAIKRGQAADRAPRLRNAVAHILLHACGQQQFQTMTSRHYYEMLQRNDAGLLQFADDIRVPAVEVASYADAALTRRIECMHPSSLAALEEEVFEMQALITPELEHLCPQECLFLKAYDDFKRAFPRRFT